MHLQRLGVNKGFLRRRTKGAEKTGDGGCQGPVGDINAGARGEEA